MSGCFVLRANLGVSCCYSATLEQFEKQVRDRRGRESMDYDHLSGVNIGCHQAHTCVPVSKQSVGRTIATGELKFRGE